MYKRILPIMLIAFMTFSCHPKRDPDQVQSTYLEMFMAMRDAKPIKKRFNDNMMASIDSCKNNPNFIIDTTALKLSLDSAIAANDSALSTIDSLDEIDDELKLKQKTIEYCTTLNEMYNRDFPMMIRSLAVPDDKISSADLKLFHQHFAKLEIYRKEIQHLSDEVRVKYDLQWVTDDLDSILRLPNINQ